MIEQQASGALDMVLLYGPKLALALVVLFAGFWVIKKAVVLFDYSLAKREVELTLKNFLLGLSSVLMKALLLISVASMIGIATTSFIAVLAAAGLAVGLALQGSLANFAGGVLLLLFKPYKAGDFIETQGHSGTVHKIQIFNTILKTPDNKTVIIPNGPIANSSLTNFSAEETRRVDMVFGIGYQDDIDKAKGILQTLIEADSRILKEPASAVLLAELADSSVNFNVRVWVDAADYWDVYYDMHESVKKALDKEGVSIPYPQQELHIHQTAEQPFH
jgi:small conductance mechanosensitive channel